MNKASRSRALGWAALGLLGAAVVQSCSASEAPDGSSDSGGTAGTSFPEAGDGETGIVNPPDDGGAGGRSPYNPLCGVDDCLPDRADACPPTTSGDLPSDPSAGGTPGGAQALPEGAGRPAGGADDGGATGDGGRGGDAGGLGGQAGVSGSGGRGGTGPTTVVNACQVRLENDRPRAKCGPAGSGAVDAPCLSDANCAPGLACVREGDAGQCRAYCCDEQSCSERTHCLERPLFGARPALTVPVCVPAVDCGLAEPYPCPEGATCSCPDGLSCMVAGADRSTTCVEPGDGMEGEECPCYWGHVCSNVTNRCVKLCQTAAPELACATGICQASAELPGGWGVCVGVARPDAG